MLVVLGVLLTVLTLFRGTVGHAAAGSGGAHVTIVQPGDTLWSIATQLAPHSDPRDVVEKIRILNHLSSADVAAGQRLRLPA